MNYATQPVVNIVTCCLIVLGGIGYIVWWDVIRVFGQKQRRTPLHFWKHLTLQSKMAIFMTLVLIFGGAALILAFEYNNPLTLGSMTLPEKIQAAIFQSVTTRTAGFATIPQQSLTNGAAVASLLLSLESVFSALFGCLLIPEQKLTSRELIGCVLMFLAIVLAQLPERKASAKR